MPTQKSYARLGLFIVIAAIIVLGTAWIFIERMRAREVIGFVTYSSENVSGLDVSSPVRYRGVPVGRVTDLRVDPSGSGRTIEIDFEIFQDRVSTLGSDAARMQRIIDSDLLSRLRALVVSNPVTGEAYLFIDVPDNPPPPPVLGFTPTRPYIPSMPTRLSALQDRLPEVLERLDVVLRGLRDVAAAVPEILARSDRFLTEIERLLRTSELPQVATDSRRFFGDSGKQFERMAVTLETLAQHGETLAAAADETVATIRTADLAGTSRVARDAADQSSAAAQELRRSLPIIRDSLVELRELARGLQDQPESLVYGNRPPPKKK
jgi:paraquat-inducible protein B